MQTGFINSDLVLFVGQIEWAKFSFVVLVRDFQIERRMNLIVIFYSLAYDL